ncbi:MAG: PIG-L family deacetylase [Clostridia bacterium]|nr:PIG-L family deacetylase [Clostridia bacterium]
MKRIICTLAVLALFLCSLSFPASAAGLDYAFDSDVRTRAYIKSVTLPAEITEYVNIIYWETPIDFTVSAGEKSEGFSGEFLHRAVKLSEPFSGDITITFSETAIVSEIEIADKVPENAQFWEKNDGECDLLILSTHADDEQLFFAGVLPLYANNKDCETQVVYFTNHYDWPVRRHEALNGLWAVGVTRYPVWSDFPDAYAASRQTAINNLENAGFSEADALNFQIEQIRRFKPQVILGHDLAGEYGHGQHILNATLLTQAVVLASDGTAHPESAEKYGVHDTPKLYLHLYPENTVTLDLDTPIEGIGKTPYQLSKDGYSKHRSQAEFWFTAWLCGENGEYTSASQIDKYSPTLWGLYHSTVGPDTGKNDIFENLTFRSLQASEPLEQPPSSGTEAPEQAAPEQGTENSSYIGVIVSVLATIFSAIVWIYSLKLNK